ncbi:hypothetical protein Arash_gp116c [Salmonella phage Arash]|nr:hypothetical protein Arash_gp116c [Salmonella phage Arash]
MRRFTSFDYQCVAGLRVATITLCTITAGEGTETGDTNSFACSNLADNGVEQCVSYLSNAGFWQFQFFSYFCDQFRLIHELFSCRLTRCKDHSERKGRVQALFEKSLIRPTEYVFLGGKLHEKLQRNPDMTRLSEGSNVVTFVTPPQDPYIRLGTLYILRMTFSKNSYI